MAEQIWLGNIWDEITGRSKKPGIEPTGLLSGTITPEYTPLASEIGLLSRNIRAVDLPVMGEQLKRNLPAVAASVPGTALDIFNLPTAAREYAVRKFRGEPTDNVEFFPASSQSYDLARQGMIGLLGEAPAFPNPQTEAATTLTEMLVPIPAASAPRVLKATRDVANRAAEAVERSPVGQGILAMQEQRGMTPEGILGVSRMADQQPSRLGEKQPIGLFSALETAARDLPQQKGSGQQMLAMIQKQGGVKPEEVQWTGLDEFLKSKPTVTKGEIEDYLLSNRVELRETTLGIGPWDASKQSRLDELMNEYANLQEHPIDAPNFGEEKYDELLFLVNAKDPISTQDLYRRADLDMVEGQRAQRRGNNAEAQRWFRSSEFNNARAEFQELRGGGEGKPKFGQYTLPGGENYREVLLTLPNEKWGTISLPTERVKKIAGENLQSGQRFNYKGNEYKFVRYEGDKAVVMAPRIGEQPEKYRSSHYDQPNILAHVRLNDRIDADGKKVLFVEEVQSDWHQAGRKSGYVGGEKHHVAYYDTPKGPVEIGYGKTAEEAMANADPGWKGLVEIKTRAEKIKEGEGVPDAPFKTSWHELALRRIMQEASEKGYDRIAFTKGAQQAQRYDLSQQVDSISWADAGSSKSLMLKGVKGASGKDIEIYLDKDTNKVKFTDFGAPSEWEGKDLADIVGKEVAEKVANSADGSLSGDGLAVGGEGMKGFYDKILPKSLNKLGKKFDAKVGTTNLQTGDEVWSMDITPKMRKTAKEQGMPLFSAAPAIPGAGLLADQEDKGENRPMRSLMDF